MNVYDYIKNYAKFHNIENYDLKSKFFTKNMISETLLFSGGVAFFYKLFAEGEITATANLQKKFLEIETPTDWWDLSPVVEITDFGSLQKVSTDFIFTADNTLDFKLFEGTEDAMFAKINNFCAQYIYLTPLPEKEKGNSNSKIKVKVDY